MPADQTVLKAFQRFDKDGSGSITRDELSQVLRGLKSSEWDDDSIDQLLAAADSSGDGQLQVEEFVKWIFAEEQTISAGATGKFRLRVSGCSRPELDGDYVQQKEFYYRRPIFHCRENERYLFYHGKRQQWQIFSRTGTVASARLKTLRAAHMPGDGVKWAVWKASKKSHKKSFIQESRMKCTAEASMTAEEEFAKAADAIKFDEIFFKKTEQTLGKRPVYKQWKGDDWAERFLFYEGPKSMWKVGNSADLGRPSLYTSRTTDVFSPDLALWMDEANGGKIAVLAVDTDGVPNGMHGGLKINRSIKDGWKDPAFPHNNDSVGAKAASKCKYSRWLRAMALHPAPALFADVEPADACQGTVGNCWLVAAMSALAEFPSYIQNNLFVTKKVSRGGKYQVKLYDGRTKRWEIIEVDDYLPCTPWGGDEPDLLFGTIKDGKMCMALLEKAFAKMYGSWSALTGGYQAVAWFHMTSCTEFMCYSASYRGSAPKWVVTESGGIPVFGGHSKDKAKKKIGQLGEGAHFVEKQRIGPWMEFKKLDGEGAASGWMRYYGNGRRLATRTAANELRIMLINAAVVPEEAMGAICSGGDKTRTKKAFKYKFKKYVEIEDMWQLLMEYDKGNYLMASSASKSRIERDSGMVHGHAYSVLHVVEIDGLRLVCCRNPWGNESEWNGPWSDRSCEWKANPKIAEALNVDFQTEGTFWMDFEDWLYVMGQLKVMNCQMPSRRGDFHNQIVEEDEDEQEEDVQDVEEEEEGGTPVTGCSGLSIGWHPARTMEEGMLLYPEKDYTFKNIPDGLLGGTYIGSKCWPKAGTWTIEYKAPAMLYVWATQGQFNGGVDEALNADGWTAEAAEGFCGGALSLNLWSKQFTTGSSYSIEITADTMIGGVVGTAPCAPCVPVAPPESSAAVTGCSGCGVDWRPALVLEEGVLLYPEKAYKFQNVPDQLLGGAYIGSHLWPTAGTWTIEYQAPAKLYVWVAKGEYNGGVDEALCANGWAAEAAEGFSGGGLDLNLWSRHFTTGSAYKIQTNGLMCGGVVGKPLECSGRVTACSGLRVGWNPPRGMAEGILIYTDKDYTFQEVPACLASGSYIGSQGWPSAGTWTIEYEPPTTLYVWAQQGTYNAGVDEALKADGWVSEDAADFSNVALGLDGFGSGLPLNLWSRHFATGSSYSIRTNDLMIGGVISECSDV
eukprot:CAMPEP_0181423132 /NCGR_PEP_ID=MMETSP1110-20121109/13972_1 /TAXON_ID=174948 /ORGANISM="Symbiodinium sp., Strain CCMP421" /LENGTH=1183 /DNA_ID=CAMNT_0023546251 /DNA_START=81 /DNA_END=3632 /DNA_ORIENTATION=-